MAKVFGGRWKIIEPIKRGGQGQVYRVVDATGELEGEFALKRVLNPKRRDRFIKEVMAIKTLSHLTLSS